MYPKLREIHLISVSHLQPWVKLEPLELNTFHFEKDSEELRASNPEESTVPSSRFRKTASKL